MNKSKINPSWTEITTVASVETWDCTTLENILKNHRKEKNGDYQQLVRFFNDQAKIREPLDDGKDKDDGFLLPVLEHFRLLSTAVTEEHASLINAVLRCEWCDGSEKIFKVFESYVASLLTSRPSFVDVVLQSFVKRFHTVPFDVKPDLESNTFKIVHERTRVYFERINNLILRAVEIVPLSTTKLMKFVGDKFPYKLRAAEEHLFYTSNVLLLHRKLIASRPSLIALLVEYIAKIDADAGAELNDLEVEDSDSENENEESSGNSWKTEHPTAERLDLILTLLFEYIDEIAADSSNEFLQLRQFYTDSLPAFEGYIFKSPGLTHVQYIWFYISTLRQQIGEEFLRKLLDIIVADNRNRQPILRQYAACYISSFLARAKSIPLRIVVKYIDQMVIWIQQYIKDNDNVSLKTDRDKIHRVFYAICQNVFYLITFRHREIFGQRKGILWFKALNFDRIILCRLNPLKYTQKIVVDMFADVTRKFNLLFCYTVIEQNNRMAIFAARGDENQNGDQKEDSTINPLNTFFPFEPYVLKRSKRFIVPHYRTYGETIYDEIVDDDTYRGLIADSDDSNASEETETVDPRLLDERCFKRQTSRKRQLSENNT